MEDKTQTTFRIGPIRPPSEADSLLLQITAGCTWNKCKFCQLYKHGAFKAFTVESVKKDIDVMADYARQIKSHLREDGTWNHREAMDCMEELGTEEQNCYYMLYRWIANGGENVFLQDGNSLAVKTEKVVEILTYLRKKFPTIKRVTTYGRAETLSKISVEQYKELKKAGLDRIHSGYESGSDRVLDFINKGVSAEQEITAGKNIKAAGIELSVYFMPGIGGKEMSKENAIETARVIRKIDPDFVRIRSAVVKKETELWEEYLKGNFKLCSDNEKIEEIKILIENLENCNGVLASDHIINLLQDIQGSLKNDRADMLEKISEYLSLSWEEQKLFQAARRWGIANNPKDLANMQEGRLESLKMFCKSFGDGQDWDLKLNEIMTNYI